MALDSSVLGIELSDNIVHNEYENRNEEFCDQNSSERTENDFNAFLSFLNDRAA